MVTVQVNTPPFQLAAVLTVQEVPLELTTVALPVTAHEYPEIPEPEAAEML